MRARREDFWRRHGKARKPVLEGSARESGWPCTDREEGGLDRKRGIGAETRRRRGPRTRSEDPAIHYGVETRAEEVFTAISTTRTTELTRSPAEFSREIEPLEAGDLVRRQLVLASKLEEPILVLEHNRFRQR